MKRTYNEQVKKRNTRRIISVICIIAGLFVLLFPYAGRMVNHWKEKRRIEEYAEADPDEQEFKEAEKYNQKLARSGDHLIEKMENEKSDEYEKLLNPQKDGMMGYLDIPRIHVLMPIYHYSDSDTLENGVGHIHGSSLPVGGKSTHCVLTGHRGLLTNKMLTDLDQMEEGDQFVIHVLNKDLTYEVDQIQTVLPDEMDSLSIEQEKDYVTLITCTPYGVNDHRLLVRGHRISNKKQTIENTGHSFSVESPVTLIVIIVVISNCIIFFVHLYEHRGA